MWLGMRRGVVDAGLHGAFHTRECHVLQHSCLYLIVMRAPWEDVPTAAGFVLRTAACALCEGTTTLLQY